MSSKLYPEYKDSGVESLGHVPAHWDVAPLSRFVNFGNGSDYKDIEVESGGYPVIGSGGEFRRSSEYLFDGESVLFGRKGTVDKPLYVNGKFWTVDTMYYTRIDPHRLLPKFLYYWALRVPFDLYVTSTALPSMTQTDLGSAKIGLPGLREQEAISNYLDRETAEIDAFIADQEELISLLGERRKSALYAFTAATKDAPKVRLRYLYRQSRAANRPDLEVLSVYRDHGVVKKSSRADNFNKTPEDTSRYLVVHPEYLVVNKMKAWQGSLGVSSYGGIVSPDYEVLAPLTDDLRPAYAHHILRSAEYVADYAVRSVGIRPSQWRLYWDQLKDITITVPSKQLQLKFLDKLQEQTLEIDATIAEAREAIALSKERRAALIIAAVTGKIDVSEAMIPASTSKVGAKSVGIA